MYHFEKYKIFFLKTNFKIFLNSDQSIKWLLSSSNMSGCASFFTLDTGILKGNL